MLEIAKVEELAVPEGCKVQIKARTITVEGPRGKLTKSIKHVDIDMKVVKKQQAQLIKLTIWHASRKHAACLRTVKSLLENMITGVTKGFLYKMKAVYAHFPVNLIIADDKKSVQIRNFLGEKLVRNVAMLEGVTIAETGTKDEVAVSGNDIEAVGQSAASIHTSCLVKNKDIRKFLDGIYVSAREHVVMEE